MNYEIIEKIKSIINTYENALNLCAAENIMSEFSKIPLSSNLQEKYIMGGTIEWQKEDNFIDSEQLFELYEILNNLCSNLFNSNYADARTLTGMNAITTLLMALTEQGDTIYLSNSNVGGHGSFPKICKRLGLNIYDLPYDYTKRDFLYDEINDKIANEDIKIILIGLSDILYDLDIAKLNLTNNTILIYDITQTLGLIAGKVLKNPLDLFEENSNVIMLGATHKTLPGPSCGLILTKNLELAKKFDTKINPDYIRNVQIHQILSLIYTLIEFQEYGEAYSKKIIDNANILGDLLSKKGYNVVKNQDCFTQTHQLFIILNEDESDVFMNNAIKYNVLLNFRRKKIYNNNGIRIGVQEVTRMGFDTNEMIIIADIIEMLKYTKVDDALIKCKISKLNEQKKTHYTYDKETYDIYNVF